MTPAADLYVLTLRGLMVVILFWLASWTLRRWADLDLEQQIAERARRLAGILRGEERRGLRALRDAWRARQDFYGRRGRGRWRLQHLRALRRRGLAS